MATGSAVDHCGPEETAPEPVAIVGIGCRMPGASGWPQFWRLLREGRDAITEIPPERFDVESLFDPRPGTPGRLTTRWGGLIEDIAGFDAGFFGIAPREAVGLDPQHRLLLEVGWEALEDAGEVPSRLAGSATGVFIGETSADYGDMAVAETGAAASLYNLTGSARSMGSGRLSYALDLRGPSMTVDAACASSLLAVHLACQSIWRGESAIALAGGTNLVLNPWITVGWSQGGMMASDGRCKAFSSRGDGFVRSDGIGLVVLKPLSQARMDDNPVYAVIIGSATGSDGRSGGMLMAPAQAGQEAVLRAAYAQAGVDPGLVQYVEAHGTGTAAGDPVEVAALTAVIGAARPAGRPCRIGSVKANIGHTEAAAGIAGLIKAALCLHHRQIPASLHSAELNPAIGWETAGFSVQRELEPWPEGPRALAGVNSFGISGTDVHVVLEAAPAEARPARAVLAEASSAIPGQPDGAAARTSLLPVSARSASALQEMARAYAGFLSGAGDPGETQSATFAEVCYTAASRRSHHEHRLAVVAGSADEAAGLLAGWADGKAAAGVTAGRVRGGPRDMVVFVFPGQGGQWPGMGRELMRQEPVFAAAVRACDEAMRPFAGWSLLDVIAEESWTGIDRIQPAIFAVQVGLAALWRWWGIAPDAVIGHSMGEIAAAHVAGALSLTDAARVICRRSALMRRLSGRGAMALVALPAAAVEAELVPLDGQVCVAARNGPSATVVSGDAGAVAALIERLQGRDVFCRQVDVDVASHSSQVDELAEDLLAELAGVAPVPGTVPVYSTVTGSPSDGAEFGTGYWLDNLRRPVLFAGAVEQAAEAGHGIFIEISPHPVLGGAIGQVCKDKWPQAAVLASSRRDDERRAMLEALAGLYCRGRVEALPRLDPVGARCVRLPAYQWQHENYWARFADRWKPGHAGPGEAGAPRRHADGSLAHPLLGRYFRSASRPELHAFSTTLGPSEMSYLGDHQVQGSVVFPAAGYVEMALAAAREVLGPRPAELSDVRLSRALVLASDPPPEIRLELATEGSDRAAFEIFSVTGDGADSGTQLHASGMVRLATGDADAAADAAGWAAMVPHGAEPQGRETLYAALRQAGLGYGPAFRCVAELRRGDGVALGRIELPEGMATEAGRYLMHPAVMDSCFQVLASAAAGEAAAADGGTFVPVALKRLCLARKPDSVIFSHARIGPADEAGQIAGDITVTDASGRLVLSVQGLAAARIPGAGSGHGDEDPGEWMYTLGWELSEPTSTRQPGSPETPPARPQPAPDERWLVLADDRGVGAALATALEGAGAQCHLVWHGVPGAAAASGRRVIDPGDSGQWRELLAHAGPVTGIAHLWSLDIPEFGGQAEEASARTLRTGQALGCASVMRLVQALAGAGLESAPRLFLVTAGSQRTDGQGGAQAVAQSPLWGMGRALSLEQPEFRCTLVDLDPGGDPAQAAALCRELHATGAEYQVALRGHHRYLARLTPLRDAPADPAGAPRITGGAGDAAVPARAGEASVGEPVMLVSQALGVLDSLQWSRTGRRPPGPGEVEIAVSAVGLNLKDVLLALGLDMGQEPGSFEPGWECSGRIVGLGDGVTELAPGDEVMVIAYPCFSSYLTVDADRVMPVPSGWSLEEAAAFPVAHGTAYYSLVRMAGLTAGERVLIHAAAGGVGLAAVRIAQALGAEVFATAGSPAKREFLRAAGVRHVLDSRSLEFAGQVMALTGGQGMDVVLNSLAGTAMERSLDTLGSFGRFVEIGVRDIYQHNRRIGLRHFRKSQSFMAVDLKLLMDERPRATRTLMREAVGFAVRHGLGPPPHRLYPADEVSAAFRHMTEARHIGKLVIGLTGPLAPSAPRPDPEAGFRPKATYLITGGQGGLGLTVAQWLADHGARHLVLAGRRPAAGPARQAITALRGRGVTVAEVAADVTDPRQVREMAEMIGRDMPQLRGVIHAAAVLDDGVVTQLTEQRLLDVLAPKVLGAWQLHLATLDAPLDFFVLFSSAAGLFGSPGQANYCAANTFLDSLAQLRRSQGRPGLSIDWGAWAEVGLAAQQDNRGQRLAARGMASMKPAKGLQALSRVLALDTAQVAVVPFDYRRWCEYYPRARDAAVFARLPRPGDQAGPGAVGSQAQAIRSAEPGQRRLLIESFLSERGARILGFTSGQLDLDASLPSLGLDSLMAVELRNMVSAELGVDIPVMSMLQGTSIGQLAQVVEEQIGAGQPPPAGPDGATGPEAELQHLSDQEVADLLQYLETSPGSSEEAR